MHFVDDGVGAEATGTYICRAENQIGSAQETVHITVAGNYIYTTLYVSKVTIIQL